FQAEDGIRDKLVTGVQTCALPIFGNPEADDEDEELLYEISALIPRIVELWNSLPYEKRISFVGALVRHVILSRPTSGWLKMEIRSEERRVGKERRDQWWTRQGQKI